MIWLCLHGWGSSACLFAAHWDGAEYQHSARLFLDGLEADPVSGERRWFPFSGKPETLAASMQHRVAAVEQAILARLATAGVAPRPPLGVLGHSQGGMLALALALRQRLPVAQVECYAAYLPPAYPAPSGPGPHEAVAVTLFSSSADRWVPPAAVRATAERLRGLGLRQVRHRIIPGLPHAFSPAWIEAARSVDDVTVD